MDPFEAGLLQIFSLIIFFLLLFLGVWAFTNKQPNTTQNIFTNFLAMNTEQLLKITVYFVTGIIFLLLVFWMVGSQYRELKGLEGFQGDLSSQGGSQKEVQSSSQKEGFQSEELLGQNSLYNQLLQTLEPNERYLMNLQPLTAMFGGFMGPIDQGKFSPGDYIRKALKAGVRCFVLPISRYFDDNKKAPNWPPSGGPSIVFRDAEGNITSTNGIRVADFARALVLAMSENPQQSNEPILLYLLQDIKVPDSIEEEQTYVTFMHDIAKDLKVLDSNRLTSAGIAGSAVGGQAERAILMEMPLEDLKNKILIGTNFKTSLALKDKYKSMSPSLHQYSNFILTSLSGTTQAAGQPNIVQNSGNPSNASVLLKLSDVIGSSVAWSDQSRTIWHAALLNDPYTSPTVEHVEQATKKGIQSIALPFFYTGEEEQKKVKSIWKTWNGYAWRVKEKDLRFAKPIPVVVKPADPRMSAVAAPGLMPGQMAVK